MHAPFARRDTLAVAALALLYAVIAKLGLGFDAVSGFATLVWPPTGLALATLLLCGARLWPGVFLGAWAVNVWAGASATAALGIATGNTLEAIVGAFMLRRVGGFDGRFDGLRQVLVLILGAALLSTLISATFGVVSLGVAGMVLSPPKAVETWRAWWVGDVLGELVVAPLLLAWGRRAGDRARLHARQWIEAAALTVLLAMTCRAIFFGAAAPAYPFGSPYMLFPLFVWAALRFELRGTTLATTAVSAVAVWSTAHGMGPFVRERLASGLLDLQTFMGCVTIAPLVVAGVTMDRARAIRTEAALRAATENRFRIFAHASRILVEPGEDAPLLLNRLAMDLVEVLGDACAIHLLTEDRSRLDLVALHHPDPDRIPALRELFGQRFSEGGDPSVARVIEADTPLLWPRVSLDDTSEAQVYAVLTVPLRSRDQTVGAITVARVAPGRSYTLDDQRLLEELGDRTGLALDNARLHRDLMAAIRARDDFLAVAGHELRTPLAGLLMQLQLAHRLMKEDQDPKRAKQMDRAIAGARRLGKLIDQLLDVSRIRAGRLVLEPEPVDLAEIVKEVVARFDDASVIPIILISNGPVRGSWDPQRVEQVISNLVGNAVKYGAGQPVEVEVTLGNAEAVVRVRDHGIGIDEAHQQRIFERFERAVANRDAGGFGLGLWISREIVDASGGRIDVQSTLGKGSVFTVHLPAGNGALREFAPIRHE